MEKKEFVLPAKFVTDVVLHMNTDHVDSLRDYVYAYTDITDVEQVALNDLSEKSMTLSCVVRGEVRTVKIPLLREINRPEQVRGVLVAMAKEARQILKGRSGSEL